MGAVAQVLLGIVGLAVLLAVTWRLASRRRALPCPAWLGWLVELDNPFTKTNRAETIVRHLDLKPGMRVLDVGCGPGRLTVPVATRIGEAGKVLAMDVQARMLSRAREKVQAANLTNVEFLEAGVGEGQLEGGRFDRALLVTVLGEIPNREAALKEIFDALRPGGVLSVTEVIFDPHFQSRSTVRRLAREVGFQENASFGSRLAFTLNFEKPRTPAASSRAAGGSSA